MSYNLLGPQLYLENASTTFSHGVYLEAFTDNNAGNLDKEIWTLGSNYSASGVTATGTAGAINVDANRRLGSPNAFSRSRYRIFVSYDNNLPYTWYLSYVQQSFGGGLGSTNSFDWNLRNEVDITTWIMDGLVGDNGNNLAYPFAMSLRQEAETNSSLGGQRRLWIGLRPYNDPVQIKQLTATSSSVNSDPSFWTQTTGASSKWEIPTGGTNEPHPDEFIVDFTVSYDGKYILIVTRAGNLYLFENDDPWNIDGNITAIQSATTPLVGNSRPVYIKYNDTGTKLFVVDMSSIIFEYDVGT